MYKFYTSNLQPLQVYRDEYTAQGFELGVVELLHVIETPVQSSVLTTNQIIGIALGGGIGLLLVVLTVLFGISW